jgi:prepilin-type N-terminal cleavage/methylation domain-containing protein
MNHGPRTTSCGENGGRPLRKWQEPLGHATRPMPRRGGFSLSEILVATAVLGVGLVMVIAVFPAAIEVNKDSTADVMGTMICENALNVAKTELKTSQVPNGTFGTGVSFSPGLPASPTWADLTYPAGDANLYRGCLVLARQVTAGRNDYQFVLAAFTKSNSNNYVRAHALAASFDANAMTFSAAGQTAWLKIGAPVIDPVKGDYANIAGFTSTGTVYLNHPLDRGPIGARTINAPLVIVETTDALGTSADAGVAATPVTCIMIARSGLKQ